MTKNRRMLWWIVGALVWVIAIVIIISMCVVASKADEHIDRKDNHEL